MLEIFLTIITSNACTATLHIVLVNMYIYIYVHYGAFVQISVPLSKKYVFLINLKIKQMEGMLWFLYHILFELC